METTGITLIGSLTSPYVRKLRLFLHQKPYTFKTVDLLKIEEREHLKTINPIGKIPVLIHQGKPLFESRVIYRYLNQLLKLERELTLEQENTLSIIDGLMDATILLFLMNREGISITQDPPLPFVNRQRERIKLLLTELSKVNFAEWNFVTMSLYAYLDWAQFRNMISLESYPILKNFHQKFSNAPGVNETKIPN